MSRPYWRQHSRLSPLETSAEERIDISSHRPTCCVVRSGTSGICCVRGRPGASSRLNLRPFRRPSFRQASEDCVRQPPFGHRSRRRLPVPRLEGHSSNTRSQGAVTIRAPQRPGRRAEGADSHGLCPERTAGHADGCRGYLPSSPMSGSLKKITLSPSVPLACHRSTSSWVSSSESFGLSKVIRPESVSVPSLRNMSMSMSRQSLCEP